jgi:hypothetical protein
MAVNEIDRMFEAMIDVLKAAILDTSEAKLNEDQAARLRDTLEEIEDIHESYLEVLFDRLSKQDPGEDSVLTIALQEIRAKLQGGPAQKEHPNGDLKKETLH